MARLKDVGTFDTRAFRETVASMRARGEGAHDRGQQVFRETGQLDPMVNIHGQKRLSRNGMIPYGEYFRLPQGPKLPVLEALDGTGSMGKNVANALYAMENIQAMLAGMRDRYQPDLSFAVMQDVGDPHPPFQMAEFESDQRTAEHVRLLVPDKEGGDAPEDYDLGLAYVLLAVETDISDHYGLKGHLHITGDQIGRGLVRPEAVKRYIGHTLQAPMETAEICRQVLKNWHLFYVQVGSSGAGGRRNEVTSWWEDKLGPGRVVIVHDPAVLVEVQAGLVYAIETAQPSLDGLANFLSAGGANRSLGQSEVMTVWAWLQLVKDQFGAQTRLPGYGDLPKPGDLFTHYRHAWPIGHPRAGENVTPDDSGLVTGGTKPPAKPEAIDWSNL